MHDSGVQTGNLCAGMNRHAAKDERDLQEKGSAMQAASGGLR
jgi:hypothetical protein